MSFHYVIVAKEDGDPLERPVEFFILSTPLDWQGFMCTDSEHTWLFSKKLRFVYSGKWISRSTRHRLLKDERGLYAIVVVEQHVDSLVHKSKIETMFVIVRAPADFAFHQNRMVVDLYWDAVN